MATGISIVTYVTATAKLYGRPLLLVRISNGGSDGRVQQELPGLGREAWQTLVEEDVAVVVCTDDAQLSAKYWQIVDNLDGDRPEGSCLDVRLNAFHTDGRVESWASDD